MPKASPDCEEAAFVLHKTLPIESERLLTPQGPGRGLSLRRPEQFLGLGAERRQLSSATVIQPGLPV